MRPYAMALAFLAGCGGAGSDGAGATAGRGSAEHRPSIVFLSVDTLAAGHTSIYGYDRKTTPNLEEFARGAAVFENCFANAPATSQSYISQFTGLLPTCSSIDKEEFRTKHGRPPKVWEILRIPAGRQTLAETLRAAGYRTAAFVDNPMAGPIFGLDQGFDLYDTSASKISASDPEGGIRAIVPKALTWIDGQKGDAPFFLFINVLDVHEPNIPPPEFKDRFAGDGLGEPDEEFPVGSGGFGVIPDSAVATYFGHPPYPTRMHTAPLVARYDEEILAMDDTAGKFLDALHTRGLFDGLLMIFSADHGEAMGQAEYKFGHGTHDSEVLHVPLVLKLPGGEHAGMRIAEGVQLLDLYPTLAELLGLEAPADLAGRSLVPLLQGGTREPTRFVHECGRFSSSAVTDGEWRLLVSHPGARLGGVLSARGRAWLSEHHPELGDTILAEKGLADALRNPEARAAMEEARDALRGEFVELYHLPTDPHMRVDVSAAHPEIVARLLATLKEAQDGAALERQRVPVSAEPLGTPADLEELRLLGYAGEE